MRVKRCVSAFRCRQPPASSAFCPRLRRFAVAEAGQKTDPALKTTGIWRSPPSSVRHVRLK